MFGCNSIKEVYFGTAANRRLSGVSWSIIAPPFIIGEGWNQVAKHVGRRWETMQKQKCRRILGSGFPVENLVAVDGREIVMSHALSSLFVSAACTFFEMVLTCEKILYRLDLFLGRRLSWG